MDICMYVTKIKGKTGHEFEREKGEYMAGFGGKKRKKEIMKLYYVLKIFMFLQMCIANTFSCLKN